MKGIILITFASLLFVSCQGQWIHPTASKEKLRNDTKYCLNKAYNQYPKKMIQVGVERVPLKTTCTRNTNTHYSNSNLSNTIRNNEKVITTCVSTGGYAKAILEDENKRQRIQQKERCLEKKGYRYKTYEELQRIKKNKKR